MVIIHVYENLSVGRVDPAPHTWLEHILQFLAGPATAPAFMFALGVGIVYSRKNTPKVLLKRGLILFGGGAMPCQSSGIDRRFWLSCRSFL